MSAGRRAGAIAVAFAACVLTGCGQSGPLTLPEEPSASEIEGQESSQDDEQEENQQD